MIDTYVINLDRQIENYQKVADAMNELGGFNVQRVSAIDGKRGDHLPLVESETTWLCKETCPDSVIAIALSHKKVAQMILDSGVDYALVLEDDATPIKDGFHEKLQRTLSEVPDGWDIINLYCDGIICRPNMNNSYLSGSFAAYIISKKGARKLSKLKIYTHIDIQTHINFKKYKSSENLFITDEFNSTNSTNTSSLSVKVKQKILNDERIPKFNFIKLFGFNWIFDDFLNFVIYLTGFFIILFLKL
tara:strand:- start:1217 stop:1957 length:741 start_codon:yes stop_codon:yes gene_type:complete